MVGLGCSEQSFDDDDESSRCLMLDGDGVVSSIDNERDDDFNLYVVMVMVRMIMLR